MRRWAILIGSGGLALAACPITGDYYYQSGGTYCDSVTGVCLDAGAAAPVDGGVDAGADAGFDAGFDGGVDAGEDAGVDAGPADAGCAIVVMGDANLAPPVWQLAGLFWYQPAEGQTTPAYERVFAIGGVPVGGGYSGGVQFEDLSQSKTQWQAGGQLSTRRAAFAAVTLPQVGSPIFGSAYEMVAFGGINASGALTSMERYASTDSPPQAQPTWTVDSPQLKVARFGHAAIFEADAGTLLTCGGVGDGIVRADCEAVHGSYKFGTGWVWDSQGWQPLPASESMILPRADFAMVQGPDGRSYAIGGGGPEETVDGARVNASGTWEVFDGGAWGAIPTGCGPFLAQPRVGAAAAVVGTRLYLIGGHANAVDPAGTNSVEYCDFDGGTQWALDPRILNYARYDLAAVVLPGGTIRIFGGINDGCPVGVPEDLATDAIRWTTVVEN